MLHVSDRSFQTNILNAFLDTLTRNGKCVTFSSGNLEETLEITQRR